MKGSGVLDAGPCGWRDGRIEKKEFKGRGKEEERKSTGQEAGNELGSRSTERRSIIMHKPTKGSSLSRVSCPHA